jgi:endonuclease/exonuclease/phosphatase family metal-dependent hydrolase
MSTLRAASVALLAGLGIGCATAHNYLERDGPRYEGSHAAPREQVAPATVRVVTFNIEYAKRMERAIAALRDRAPLRDPDLLLLQEMDAAGVDAAARGLGLNFVYFPGSRHPKTKRDLGNAVLSPWPIEAAWKLPMPHPSRILRQARAAVGARVRIGDRAVRVYSLHLGSPLAISGGKRRDQIEVVLADARDSLDPVVIGGDFNSKGVGRTIVAAGFHWPTERVGGTRGWLSFDHVFARGLGPAESSAGVVRDVDASDHRPVWAVLAFAPTP